MGEDEGHEGHEEEGCYEAPCHEGSSRGTSPNEEDEGHEGDEEKEGHEGHEGHGCHEGYEGHEGHEVIELYHYTEAIRCHAMKAKTPASMKGVNEGHEGYEMAIDE